MIHHEPWYLHADSHTLQELEAQILRSPEDRDLVLRYLQEVHRHSIEPKLQTLERVAQSIPTPHPTIWSALWAASKREKRYPEVPYKWVEEIEEGDAVEQPQVRVISWISEDSGTHTSLIDQAAVERSLIDSLELMRNIKRTFPLEWLTTIAGYGGGVKVSGVPLNDEWSWISRALAQHWWWTLTRRRLIGPEGQEGSQEADYVLRYPDLSPHDWALYQQWIES